MAKKQTGIIGKSKEILEGWSNLVVKKEDVEKVAKHRLNICNDCEHNSKFHKTTRPDMHCVECGCTLKAKVRSLQSECPIRKWPKYITNETRKE